MDIREQMNQKVLLFDGATGTIIQKTGIQIGKVPELLNFTHGDKIEAIHEAYFLAGSDIVSSNTFGANAYKTAGCGYTVEQIVAQGVKLAKNAAKRAMERSFKEGKNEPKYVALDVAPIGKLMEPYGPLTFEEAYAMFREQIEAGVKAGVDLILLETFTDIYELKIAVLAAKECCDLPVFCSLTFQEDGRMLMGTDPLTAITILQDMGIDTLGMNCSLGPKQMIPLVQEFLHHSKVPVLVQPNAGLPTIINGETIYDVSIKEYTEIMVSFVDEGLAIAGGCCGTTPDYILSLAEALKDKKLQPRSMKEPIMAVSSATKTVFLDDRIRIIGERINPTGKKRLKEALKLGDYSYIENEAIQQVEAGAEILDINVGLPEMDELSTMLSVVKKVSAVVDVPLQIDSADSRVLEAAVRTYNGKPIINSVNGKEEVMDAVFPIVKKYGACVIALTLDEKGLPKNAEERVEIADRIIKRAAEYGIGPDRILVDCLTLTVSAQQNAGRDTLEAIRRVKQKYGVKTTLGASNVSFGLPERILLNRTFLAMALEAGLDAPITDPLVPDYVNTISAFEALSGKDIESKNYIDYYGTNSNGLTTKQNREVLTRNTSKKSSLEAFTLEEIILNGYEDRAAQITEELLKTEKPLEIVEKRIIPSLEQVGKEYETGEKFLPQLMKAADTVTRSFHVLKEAMKLSGESINYGRIILATVEGDVHDIGKNIVKVILENYGYEVLDLGKDVPVEKVVEVARNENIQLVGLSALMTTTVVSMEKTIKKLEEAGLSCKTAVGGAVLTKDYAEEIGADYYCKDAMDTVKAANEIFKN
ncbi:homocysteine S-methyltransferase family protein [Anaerovorax sp. IOR16]|uniref:homocysteine S-methyltransferase family protein n=1 Tax=Anaerovorax sp. IOR16 TaxID=2773458 RepID=UPI0019D24C48|nr:homocysteine S-methyltransferase family protein [Anaerovorax sp. IOR16]